MEDTVNGHGRVRNLVEDRVGKSPDQRAAARFVNFGMHLGRATDSFDAGTDSLDASIGTTEKFFSQSTSTFLVPAIGVADIELSFRRDNQFSGHTGFGPCV